MIKYYKKILHRFCLLRQLKRADLELIIANEKKLALDGVCTGDWVKKESIVDRLLRVKNK